MSVGRNLQEMENVVTKGAAPAEAPRGSATPVATPGQTGAWEDLGGPTPENYRPDDESGKLKDPSATLAQVRDVVNAKAVKAEAVKEESEKEEEDEDEEKEEKKSSKKKHKEEMKEESEEGEDLEDVESEEEVEEEEEEVVEEDFNIEEDVNALLAGEELSEEFQEKAKTIFEAAIRSKVATIKEHLQEVYAQQMVEELQYIKEELTDRVDSYLEYVADEWFQENALAVEHGLQSEMTESFLQGLKGLFEEHYVSIPEEKYDVVYNMVDKLDEMEEKLNEQIERNIALNKRLAESVADVIFAEVSEGLALSQRDKLASLAENVEFDSEADYREKLETLRNSYFPTNTSAPKNVTENLSEEVAQGDMIEESYSPSMSAYLSMMSKVAKK
jgi:hypothetical protein